MSKNTSTEIIENNGKQLKEKYGVEVYLLLHGLSCTKLDKQQGYFLLTLMDELLKAKWLCKSLSFQSTLEDLSVYSTDLSMWF